MCWGLPTSRNRTTENPGMSDRLLVLVRHGQSEWNLKNLFTGWKDPDLTEQGITEAKEAGRKLKAQGLTFEQILKRELATGAPVIYRLNADSTVATKVDLAA